MNNNYKKDSPSLIGAVALVAITLIVLGESWFLTDYKNIKESA